MEIDRAVRARAEYVEPGSVVGGGQILGATGLPFSATAAASGGAPGRHQIDAARPLNGGHDRNAQPTSFVSPPSSSLVRYSTAT